MIKRLRHSIDIYARPERVWQVAWGGSNDGQPGRSFYAPDDTWVGHWTGVDWKASLRVLCRPFTEDMTCPPVNGRP